MSAGALVEAKGPSASVNSSASPRPDFDQPSTDFLEQIPHDFAREHLILSAGRKSAGRCAPVECLLISDRTPPAAVFNTGVRLVAKTMTRVIDSEELARRIDEAYADHKHTATVSDSTPNQSDLASIDSILSAAERDLLSTTGKGPIIRLVDALLFEALGRNASDVHVQALSDRTLVRYRIDGVLQTARRLPTAITPAVISRIKVMGRMDIAERRIPQDGRATVTIGAGERSRSIDLRIGTLPTSHGERVVIRLLESERGEHMGGLESLGMPAHVRDPFLAASARSNGIVLVTGPTGSGKTTTLYATLRWIAASRAGTRAENRDCDLNIMTIEDPIEYELSGSGVAISQAQVNSRKGVTFATGLRHILRQDPDVVMVGEIRDAETARIAIQASLTGHLVFSTLHTNDAAGAVTRLTDLGVESYLVSASLSAVLAQRLVRCVHGPCQGSGCETCFHSGYLGRTGLYELLPIDEAMRERITSGTSLSALRDAARAAGMRTLAEEGNRLIDDGVTSRLEVDRVVQATT
jgi:general secretion pathway protein E